MRADTYLAGFGGLGLGRIIAHAQAANMPVDLAVEKVLGEREGFCKIRFSACAKSPLAR